jgi:hypothetical protein
VTSIYNIEPAVFFEVLTQLLDRLGMEWRHDGPHRLLIRCREPVLAIDLTARSLVRAPDALLATGVPAGTEDGQGYVQQSAVTIEPVSPSPSSWAELVLEPFPALCHVTLRWLGSDERIRTEVEAQLCNALAQIRTRKNSSSAWFLALGLGLFLLAFLVLLALIALEILRLRH